MEPTNGRPHVVIVGGGISGLAAAFFLRDEAVRVTVLEGSPRLGGKLSVSEIAGAVVDEGAEALLVTRPEGTALIAEAGLADQRTNPGPTSSAIWTLGALRPLPRRQFMGVPSDLAELAKSGVLTGHGLARARQDLELPATGRDGDVSVAGYVGGRLGPEVVDRLVDPLLGGVYAGRAERLSLEVTMPQLARAARVEHTLRAAVRAAQAGSGRAPGRPVFGAIDGGMTRLVAAAATASGARISLGLPVRELARTRDGWRLLLGPAPAPRTEDVDVVVLAVPAKPAARLLAGVAPEAAEAVAALDYASVALAGLALPPGTELPGLSGFLVPPSEGTLVKAATFLTRKWAHLGGDGRPVIVRASLGRAGEARRLQVDDAALLERAHRELGELIGERLPTPLASWVQRWGGGLPQYAPGHRDRVALARAALPEGLALAGAALDGVGIPACVGSGELAADDLSKFLED